MLNVYRNLLTLSFLFIINKSCENFENPIKDILYRRREINESERMLNVYRNLLKLSFLFIINANFTLPILHPNYCQ